MPAAPWCGWERQFSAGALDRFPLTLSGEALCWQCAANACTVGKPPNPSLREPLRRPEDSAPRPPVACTPLPAPTGPAAGSGR